MEHRDLKILALKIRQSQPQAKDCQQIPEKVRDRQFSRASKRNMMLLIPSFDPGMLISNS